MGKTGNHLFLGPDAVTKKEAVNKLLQSAGIAITGDDPSRCLFFASESSAEEIFSECLTPSFFGGTKAVIVHEAESLPTDRVKEYFNSPSDDTLLIFLSDKNQGKFSRAVETLFKKHGEVRMFWEMFENQLESWATRKSSEYGLASVPGLGSFLVERCGRSSRLVERGIQVLANLFEGQPFTLEQAGKAVDGGREITVFTFVDSLFYRKTREALQSGRQLMYEGDDPLYLLVMIMRQHELLWKYAAAVRDGRPVSPGTLGVVKTAYQNLSRMAPRWTLLQLAEAGRELFSLEMELKSSGRALRSAAFERTVLRICRMA